MLRRKKENYNNRYPTYEKKNYTSKPAGVLFEFDPNTINEAGWKRLGLRDKTIQTIQNYLNKGG